MASLSIQQTTSRRNSHAPFPPAVAAGLAAIAAGLVAGCATVHEAVPTPPFYERLDLTGKQVDGPSSIGMINQYRSINGSTACCFPERRDPERSGAPRHDLWPLRARWNRLTKSIHDELTQSGYRYKVYAANLLWRDI